MSKPRVIGLGEILWDVFPDGRQLGGATTNFAYHAHGMGANAALVTAVGNDEPGRDILARLEGWGIDTRFVTVDPDHPTGTVTVSLDVQGVPRYVIHEDVAYDYLPASPALLEEAARVDAVCFGTLCQRSPVSRDTIQRFLEATPAGTLRVCDINLRSPHYKVSELEHLVRPANVLKLNDTELPILCQALGIDGSEEGAPDRLRNRLGLDLLALTCGGAGSILYAEGEMAEHPGFAVEVMDTVGAGDAFTAAMVMGLLRGDSLQEINESANRVAALVCSHPGGTPDIYGSPA